ncbi:MAG: TIGR02757 family protein [Vicinamibacterales bacterium]|nr:TIGR02757 family protein [Vicinamibacterales bacterium]
MRRQARRRVARHAGADEDRLLALRPRLDALYASFNRAGEVPDPVEFVRRYERQDDRELVAFLASGLAFGRVTSINQSVERLLGLLGPHPAETVAGFSYARQARRFSGFVHRWTRGDDVARLLLVLRRMLRDAGSIEGWFVSGWDRASEDVRDALESFGERAAEVAAEVAGGPAGARGVGYFFPRPGGGSACKRLNLFLRWMVRRDDLDPGGWTAVRPSQLVVPLDTHVVRVGTCLGLTRAATPGWRMAAEITSALRVVDPVDPIKYDFALCHLGMQQACGFNDPRGDRDCPLRGACRPATRRRRSSPAPCAAR